MSASPGFAATGTGWVIDASVTMPWFFPDEATPFTEALLDTLGKYELWAPTLINRTQTAAMSIFWWTTSWPVCAPASKA